MGRTPGPPRSLLRLQPERMPPRELAVKPCEGATLLDLLSLDGTLQPPWPVVSSMICGSNVRLGGFWPSQTRDAPPTPPTLLLAGIRHSG